VHGKIKSLQASDLQAIASGFGTEIGPTMLHPTANSLYCFAMVFTGGRQGRQTCLISTKMGQVQSQSGNSNDEHAFFASGSHLGGPVSK
jgi:hypothetical protein